MGGQHLDLDFQGIGIADLEQRLAGRHRALAFVQQLQHACCHGCTHRHLLVRTAGLQAGGVGDGGAGHVQFEARHLDRVSGGLLHGTRAGFRRAGGVERLCGEEIRFAQGLGAGTFLLRQLRGGGGGAGVFLGNGEGGLRGVHLRLRLHAGARVECHRTRGLDQREHLPDRNGVPRLEVDAAHVAGHRRRHLVTLGDAGLALLFHRHRERRAFHFDQIDRHGTRHEAVDQPRRHPHPDRQHSDFCA